MPPLSPTLRVATRSSALALWQTRHVADRLQASWPGLTVELVEIGTLGDQRPDVALSGFRDPGVFSRDLERALLDGRVDLAVHSLKDLPTATPEGLAVVAVLEREDPRDALVTRDRLGLDQLPAGSRIGTSSLRRRAQLAACRPDLVVAELRGNVPTRLDRVARGDYAAAVLAVAGLRRLGLDHLVTEVLEPQRMLPAPGQGAIAVQARTGSEAAQRAAVLDHGRTRLATGAERSALATLEGGCRAPVAALATWTHDARLEIDVLVASPDGRQRARAMSSAPAASDEDALALGRDVARQLLAEGAAAMLGEWRVTGAAGGEGGPVA